jgi:hypothetical protein
MEKLDLGEVQFHEKLNGIEVTDKTGKLHFTILTAGIPKLIKWLNKKAGNPPVKKIKKDIVDPN